VILRRLFLAVLFVALALAGSAEVARPAADGYDIAFLDGFCGDPPGPEDATPAHCPLCTIVATAILPARIVTPRALPAPRTVFLPPPGTIAPPSTTHTFWPPNRAPPARLSLI